jgi:hypothetical protein
MLDAARRRGVNSRDLHVGGLRRACGRPVGVIKPT